MTEERTLQIIPAAAGWRRVIACAGYEGDADTASDEDLLYVLPIACFALIETQDDEPIRYVRPVCPEDWPSYLWVEGPSQKWGIGLLGPGEEIDDEYRAEAREQIKHYRASRAAA